MHSIVFPHLPEDPRVPALGLLTRALDMLLARLKEVIYYIIL